MFGTRALVCYTAALLLGMVAARYLAPPAFLYPAAVICVVLLVLLFLKRKNSMIPLIALLALMAGFMRAYPAIYPHYPYADDATVVTVEGVVCENPVDTRYGRLIKLADGVVKEKNIPLTMGVGSPWVMSLMPRKWGIP
ncbi:MAG: DUF4131 domain-containing protein [Clostridiales bacterium]|nr:DUF4131 domain-containing protein [Clostridiales bacterium]